MRLNIGIALTFALLLTPYAARPQASPKLEFEVATVRASAARVAGERPPRASHNAGPGAADPGLLSYSKVPLSTILADAFDVYWNEISGPDWLPVDRYDIVAKVPAGTTKEQARQMLQNLLVDRFRLTYHMQTKVVDGYVLTVAPGGSRLTAHSGLPRPPRKVTPWAKTPFPFPLSSQLNTSAGATRQDAFMPDSPTPRFQSSQSTSAAT